MSSAPTVAEGTATTPLPVDTSSVPVLSESIRLTYLAEGAANVIYRLSAAPGETLPEEFVDKLIRLRKALPSAQPNLLAYSHLVHIFHPLFPASLLVPTTLIRVPKSIIIRETANLLAFENAGKRALKRRGLYLEESEEYGFLILDMSPRPLDSGSILPTTPEGEAAAAQSAHPKTRQILVEFKPKWVVQSPSAPATWRRCRTCALHLSKSSGGKPSMCPLDLASQSRDRVRHTLQYILPSSPSPPQNLQLRHGESWADAKSLIEHHAVQFLAASELMPLLKRLQSELDPFGPSYTAEHGSPDEKEKFVMAMTVRDLTIFLRIDLDGAVEARIGDLDLKTGEAGKWNYWSAVERKLVEGGWYEGKEDGAEEKGVWCRP